MYNLKRQAMMNVAIASLLMAAPIARAESEPETIKLPSPPAWSGDGWDIKLSGRVQYDYAQADAERASGFDVDDQEWRRVRLAVSGKVGSAIKYKAELNTNSSGDINAEDLFIEFAPSGAPKIKVGQFKTPNSLDEQTSSRFISTLERAAFTDAFQFNRRVGVSLSQSGDNYTLTGGVFAGNLEDGDQDQGFVAAARGTMQRQLGEASVFHAGASIRYREQGDEEGLARYRQRPYTHLPGRIISTGAIADRDLFVGIEAALISGPYWAAGEYGVLNADTNLPGGDPDLSGGYLEIGAFIGGARTYKGGKFDRPKVDKPVTQGGWGAVSGVLRFDQVDLSDGPVDGGSLDTFIAGIDWWPTRHSRIGFNYFNADASLGTSTSGLDSDFAALVTANQTAETVEGFSARLQFDF